MPARDSFLVAHQKFVPIWDDLLVGSLNSVFLFLALLPTLSPPALFGLFWFLVYVLWISVLPQSRFVLPVSASHSNQLHSVHLHYPIGLFVSPSPESDICFS
ncbi:hypothetical protein CHARACLAT_024284 [Characodon lateralis]|uniref:Uncharacterized protein n=1 Tax=Characodon lateralis TaxID=208331 RepID=A0ABU7DDR6_9TELE|nr:hypothetical protein [Characodon lateralis]